MSSSLIYEFDVRLEPLILGRLVHGISRRYIDADALKVMYRLLRSGYKAYLVGGGVRDLLIGRVPKDFDVGTDAPPEVVRNLFRNSRIIGRRFKINHVYFPGNKIIEVATFRALDDGEDESLPIDPRASDNTYGDPSSDARRRDLTINGLFYDLSTFSVIDYVGGIDDLREGIIRIIGEPAKRIKEDPVRMIRAVRHAARTGFRLEDRTYQAICELAQLITTSSVARVHEEFVRELRGGCARDSLRLLRETGLLPYLLPALSGALSDESERLWERLEYVLSQIDEESRRGRELSVGALFAVLTVGVVSPSDIVRINGDVELERALRFWRDEPVLDDVDKTLSDIDEMPVKSSDEVRGRSSGRRRRKEQSSALGTLVNALFTEVGVSRKERETMELLLRMRYALLCGIEPSNILSRCSEASTFEDLVFLLRAGRTNQSQQLAGSLRALWDESRMTQSAGGERRQRSRRRRRTRSRGGRLPRGGPR